MNCKKHTNHEHHLQQQYKGGGDEAENLVVIPDTCHTMWHWCEWQRTGSNEDRGAYLLLRGQLESESHSQKMIRAWADPVYHSWMLDCRKNWVEEAKQDDHFSRMGTKGGSVNAKQSRKVAMMNHSPQRQRQLCTQNSPGLVPLLGKWLTFKHKNGSKLTVKFDYNTRVITQKLSLLSGKVCSATMWTSLFTQGKSVAGWTLVYTSL